jgi:hypothetical protein
VLSWSTVFFCTRGGEFLYRFHSEKRQSLARGHNESKNAANMGDSLARGAYIFGIIGTYKAVFSLFLLGSCVGTPAALVVGLETAFFYSVGGAMGLGSIGYYSEARELAEQADAVRDQWQNLEKNLQTGNGFGDDDFTTRYLYLGSDKVVVDWTNVPGPNNWTTQISTNPLTKFKLVTPEPPATNSQQAVPNTPIVNLPPSLGGGQ